MVGPIGATCTSETRGSWPSRGLIKTDERKGDGLQMTKEPKTTITGTEAIMRREHVLAALRGALTDLAKAETELRNIGTQGCATRAGELVLIRATLGRSIEGLSREQGDAEREAERVEEERALEARMKGKHK